tara:strand:+ start:418 stop:618 length:201 start_codon:yes stop_codon:yes gene_type:complete
MSNNNYRPAKYFSETQAREINRRNREVMTENGKAQMRARTGVADHQSATELGMTMSEYYKFIGVEL